MLHRSRLSRAGSVPCSDSPCMIEESAKLPSPMRARAPPPPPVSREARPVLAASAAGADKRAQLPNEDAALSQLYALLKY
jgi:hypothetical protein